MNPIIPLTLASLNLVIASNINTDVDSIENVSTSISAAASNDSTEELLRVLRHTLESQSGDVSTRTSNDKYAQMNEFFLSKLATAMAAEESKTNHRKKKGTLSKKTRKGKGKGKTITPLLKNSADIIVTNELNHKAGADFNATDASLISANKQHPEQEKSQILVDETHQDLDQNIDSIDQVVNQISDANIVDPTPQEESFAINSEIVPAKKDSDENNIILEDAVHQEIEIVPELTTPEDPFYEINAIFEEIFVRLEAEPQNNDHVSVEIGTDSDVLAVENDKSYNDQEPMPEDQVIQIELIDTTPTPEVHDQSIDAAPETVADQPETFLDPFARSYYAQKIDITDNETISIKPSPLDVEVARAIIGAIGDVFKGLVNNYAMLQSDNISILEVEPLSPDIVTSGEVELIVEIGDNVVGDLVNNIFSPNTVIPEASPIVKVSEQENSIPHVIARVVTPEALTQTSEIAEWIEGIRPRGPRPVLDWIDRINPFPTAGKLARLREIAEYEDACELVKELIDFMENNQDSARPISKEDLINRLRSEIAAKRAQIEEEARLNRERKAGNPGFDY